MVKQLPIWIIEGQCFKPESVLCNLGYPCDSCPYITDRKLLEIKQIEYTKLESEIKESINKYVEYAKQHNIEIPKEFNDWNLVEQSLYIFKNHKNRERI